MTDNGKQENEMKKSSGKERKGRPKRRVQFRLNSHEWATKVEFQRVISGKPDLEIRVSPRINPWEKPRD